LDYWATALIGRGEKPKDFKLGPGYIEWHRELGVGLLSEEEFDCHIKRVLGAMRSAPRYVLGVADQVPADALERRVRRVHELVEQYGTYE
jgi:hypothetical protein